jgi:hypothetical protein
MTAIDTVTGTAGSRQSAVTVTVKWRGETKSLGIFDTMEGGGATAENTKHRRGNMGKQVAIGGPSTIEDVTVSRDLDLARDLVDMKWVFTKVGQATVVASRQFIDAHGTGFGAPWVVTGILIGCTPPPHDSDSADIAMWEIVINPDGDIG